MDWIAALGPITGILIVVVDRWLQRRKANAEAWKALAEADLIRLQKRIQESDFWERLYHDVQTEYAKLSENQAELRREVDALARELTSMKHVLGKLWAGLTVLLRQLVDNKIRPAWEPDVEMARYCSALLEDTPRA